MIEIGGDERAPIILEQLFLSIAKAIIYEDTTNICFTIGNTKERFSFKHHTLTKRVHPQRSYDYLDYDKIPQKKKTIPKRKIPKDKLSEKKPQQKKTPVTKNVYTYEGILPTPNKNNNKKGKSKAKLPNQESVWMVNTIEPPIGPASPSHLMIKGSTFYKTFYDIDSSIDIMSMVTYRHLYHDRPLYPTYLHLQLVDQSFQVLEGIAKDVIVMTRDHDVLTGFMVLDMGEEDDVHLILGRLFPHITCAIIYMKHGEIHFHFPRKKGMLLL